MGLGTQADLAAARRFRTEVGVDHRMLWDASGASWVQLGVRVQPAAVLVRADGTVLQKWPTSLDLDAVLAALPSS